MTAIRYTSISSKPIEPSYVRTAPECTNFTNEVCEAALAHVIENKAEAAYRRGDLFDKRRKLMEAWAVYCTVPKAGKVVAFKRKA